jgi:hypothetical protein
MVFRFGQTEPNTEDIGRITELTVRDVSGTQMVISLRESLKTTSLMARVHTHVRMKLFTKACGLTMCSMARAKQYGLMVQAL